MLREKTLCTRHPAEFRSRLAAVTACGTQRRRVQSSPVAAAAAAAAAAALPEAAAAAEAAELASNCRPPACGNTSVGRYRQSRLSQYRQSRP